MRLRNGSSRVTTLKVWDPSHITLYHFFSAYLFSLCDSCSLLIFVFLRFTTLLCIVAHKKDSNLLKLMLYDNAGTKLYSRNLNLLVPFFDSPSIVLQKIEKVVFHYNMGEFQNNPWPFTKITEYLSFMEFHIKTCTI